MKKGSFLIEVIICVLIFSIFFLSFYNSTYLNIKMENYAYNTDRTIEHICNISNDLMAIYNTKIINPELKYYNIDIVELIDILFTSNVVLSDLIVNDRFYKLKFIILSNVNDYYEIQIDIMDEKNIILNSIVFPLYLIEDKFENEV